MGQIKAKLNLNRTPSIVEPGTLVFAKNIRVDVDGSIHRDYSISPIEGCGEHGIWDKVVADLEAGTSDTTRYIAPLDLLRMAYNLWDEADNWEYLSGDCSIVGVISSNTSFYLLCRGYWEYNEYDLEDINHTISVPTKRTDSLDFILCYDESTKMFTTCNCKWTWSGGTIEGYVTINLLGETILTIAESEANTDVPLKCINLNKSSYLDDESLYTQTPNVPIINLNDAGTFPYTIPNGVYQFFVRYKIRKGFYTNWFPASKELFAKNSNRVVTNYGELSYMDTSLSASQSFILNVEMLNDDYATIYESFQVGYLLSTDSNVVARAWKHFPMGTGQICFDYNQEDVEEIETSDLTQLTYQVYNVGNVTSFKNKLYISNYNETNFNDDLQEYADDIKIGIGYKASENSYGCLSVDTNLIEVNGKKVVSTIDNVSAKIIVSKLLDSDFFSDMFVDTKVTSEQVTSFGTDYWSIATDRTDEERADAKTIYAKVTKPNKVLVFNTLKREREADKAYGKGQAYYNGKIINFTDEYEIGYVQSSFGTYRIEDIEKLRKANQDVKTTLTDYYKNKILSKVAYLSADGYFIDNSGDRLGTLTFKVYRKCKYQYYQLKAALGASRDNSTYDSKDQYDLISCETYYPVEATVFVTATKTKCNWLEDDELYRYASLIPYQKYKFYVHYVKSSGEISNGYVCPAGENNVLTVPYRKTVDSLIYPTFSNITIPTGYAACFFTIQHCANNVATVYQLEAYTASGTSKIEGCCMEIGLGLLPFRESAIMKYDNDTPETISKTATYYTPNDLSNGRYYGAPGILAAVKGNSESFDYDGGQVLYAVSTYDTNTENEPSLIKCTPFINTSSFSNVFDMSLGGYYCEIRPVLKSKTIEYWNDGQIVYYKDYTSASPFELTELNQYYDEGDKANTYRVKDFTLETGNKKVKVYSQFNLNCLALSVNPTYAIETYYNYASDTTDFTEVTDTKAHKQIWKLLTSATMDNVYTLPAMYYNYTRRTYSVTNDTDVVRFDNTVRSSELVGDENHIDVFKFDPEDYYNVPAHRGTITNMVSVGDAILVHTHDSMFKFTGSNTLQSSTGEIQQTESEVFDTGVSEIFGSEFGFGGLQSKHDCIITEAGYIFFDRDAKVIYMYAGNNQMGKLSDSIEKLLRCDEINNVAFANDFYNNRFYVSIAFVNKGVVTLSYNFSEQCKAFVSLHDLDFAIGASTFNTKTKCYFLGTDYNTEMPYICTIDKSSTGKYDMSIARTADGIYPQGCMVDVIDNTGYENIKTLNSLSWCSREITDEFPCRIEGDGDTKDDDGNITINLVNMVEAETKTTPCTSLLVYTDTCQSQKVDCSKRANEADSLTSVDSYKYPQYNQGYWSLNYFRNVLNDQNAYASSNGRFVSDQNSLIEGKYFVVRFVFDGDADFQLETLKFNYNTKM